MLTLYWSEDKQVEQFVRAGRESRSRRSQSFCARSRPAIYFHFGWSFGEAQDEIVEVLNISPRTVRRDWEFARVWLARELQAN